MGIPAQRGTVSANRLSSGCQRAKTKDQEPEAEGLQEIRIRLHVIEIGKARQRYDFLRH
jgi:hypothetical protein